MATSTTRELVVLLEYAHERLQGRLEGMSEHEYLWEPVPGCWSVRRGEDGVERADLERGEAEPAPLTTIAWRLWHISDDLSGFSARTFEGETERGPAPSRDWTSSAAAAVALVDTEWDRFVGHVGKLDQEGLDRPLGPAFGPYAQDSVLALVLHVADEVIHHGAEVALMRDLYRATGGREFAAR